MILLLQHAYDVVTSVDLKYGHIEISVEKNKT